MNTFTNKKLISIFISTIMVLSVFIVISSAASAQTATPVGTVSLSPSTGAFPGQIVYYTWSGVPTNLVAPVYVTVYINGAPYSNSVASYSNGVLKGTFTMPNDQPGTVFSLSFSYTDSAQNYGVSASTGTSTLNFGATPIGSMSNSKSSTTPVTYQVFGNTTNIGTSSSSIYADSAASSGSSTFKLNNGGAMASGFTKLSSSTSQTITLNAHSDFSQSALFWVNQTQNTTLNATTYNKGTASLALPSTETVPTTFTFSTSAITKINTTFEVTTTVEGVSVDIHFTGVYSSAITSTGTYTLVGSFNTLQPATLANNLTGTFSAAYDISSFNVSLGDVNYTLSITFSGSYTFPGGSTVSIYAQYLNNTIIYASGSSPLVSFDTLTLQSGYKFTSSYVGFENPGINGAYVFNYTNSTLGLYTGNVSFSYNDYTSGTLASLSTAPIYMNISKVPLIGFNESVTGSVNITITSNSYTLGVYGISPIIWNFTLLYNFSFTGAHLQILGNISAYTNSLKTVLTTAYGNYAQVYTIMTFSNLTDSLGYPYLSSLTVQSTSFLISHNSATATITLAKSVLYPHKLISSVTSLTYNGNRSVSGFNETISHGSISPSSYAFTVILNIKNLVPIIYGINTTGKLGLNYMFNESSNDSYSNIFVYQQIGSDSVSGPAANLIFTVPATNYALQNNSWINVSLRHVTVTVNYGSFTASLTSVFDGYQGALVFNGAGSNSTISKAVSSAASFRIDGNVTSLAGFVNNSMKGWYNATVSISSLSYALYGVSSFTGYANFFTEFKIKKNGTAYPAFIGNLNTTGTMILPSVATTANYTYAGAYYSSNMSITGNVTVLSITNTSIHGTFTVAYSEYGLSDSFAFNTTRFDVSEGTNSYDNSTLATTIYFVSGNVPVTTTLAYMYYNTSLGYPMTNVTLVPILQTTFAFELSGTTTSYTFTVTLPDTAYNRVLSLANNSNDYFSNVVTAYVDQAITITEYNINLNTAVGSVTLTTNQFTPINAGTYYVSGLATSVYGSGTVSATINVVQYLPKGSTSDTLVVSGSIIAQGYFANGTQFSITVNIPSVSVSLMNSYYSNIPATVSYTYDQMVESHNTGSYNFGSYSLVSGSGALVVTISNSQIAEIATSTGAIVNISLSQLDAKISDVWSAQNQTYATLTTDFGNMMVLLQTINAAVTNVSNGVATIQTTLGTIQTSLSNLNATITKLSGNVATITTDIGSIQTTLSSIKTTVTSTASSVNDLVGSVATIKTDVGTISGTITSVSNGVATIQTKLGTLQTSVSDIKTSTTNTANSVGTTIGWEIAVLVLVIITLVLTAITLGQSRKGRPPREIVKTPEETKPEEPKE